MILTPRLMELIEMCREQDLDEEYDCSLGWFDDDLTFHWDPEFPEEKLFVWEWAVWPEIVRYAESRGIEVPADPSIDFSKTF